MSNTYTPDAEEREPYPWPGEVAARVENENLRSGNDPETSKHFALLAAMDRLAEIVALGGPLGFTRRVQQKIQGDR